MVVRRRYSRRSLRSDPGVGRIVRCPFRCSRESLHPRTRSVCCGLRPRWNGSAVLGLRSSTPHRHCPCGRDDRTRRPGLRVARGVSGGPWSLLCCSEVSRSTTALSDVCSKRKRLRQPKPPGYRGSRPLAALNRSLNRLGGGLAQVLYTNRGLLPSRLSRNPTPAYQNQLQA
jgi:hypothetical protein